MRSMTDEGVIAGEILKDAGALTRRASRATLSRQRGRGAHMIDPTQVLQNAR